MSITLDATLPAAELLAEVIALTSTSHTLADEVMDAVQDASYTYADILELFNDCLLEIAGELLIPDLETWEDITLKAKRDNVRMPADYHRRLRYAHSITHNREIKVYGSMSQLYRLFSMLDQTGRVIGVALKGRNLMYQRKPSSDETLRINYYRYPPRLYTRTDKPDWLPWHIAKPLLKAFALKELYDLIEDGQDGNKTNTLRWTKRYDDAWAKLEEFIGPEEHPPVEIGTEIDWEAMM
jgi:hypothetical protein